MEKRERDKRWEGGEREGCQSTLMDRQQISLQIKPYRCGVGIDFELVMIMHQEVIN